MKFSTKTYIVLSAITLFFIFNLYEKTLFLPFPQELATTQIITDPFSPQSLWDPKFLETHQAIKEKIVKFEKGNLCNILRQLDNKNLTYKQISTQLKSLGFSCIVRPLAVDPSAKTLRYLKINNTTTQNPAEKGVAYQEIYQHPLQPECVVRIKKDGFPLAKRSLPHSTKSILVDTTKDPGSFENEAFKVSSQGHPLPKGPSENLGLKKCPYGQNRKCNQWVDAIMDEAHPLLKGF